MYDKHIKEIRDCAEWAQPTTAAKLDKAADAFEALVREVNDLESLLNGISVNIQKAIRPVVSAPTTPPPPKPKR